jgi:hypothetical protein
MFAGTHGRSVNGYWVEGTQPIRGRAMLDYLERQRGAKLTVLDGYLLDETADPSVRAAALAIHVLIIGWKMKRPLRCACGCNREATTLVAHNVPYWYEHFADDGSAGG